MKPSTPDNSRGGTMRDSDLPQRGTLRDLDNNNKTMRELTLDRRTTLQDERYGTGGGYMSEHQAGTVFIRVSVPELKVQKCLQFELDESVWEAKQRILAMFSKELRDPLNYGMYLPPMNGRAGKFLDEERLLREYPLHGPIGFLEFKYKKRVYKMIHLNPRKLKQLHNKTNFRQFIEHVKNANISKINKQTNKGLDPNFHDSSGESPLTFAVSLSKEKCKEVIISLVSGGAHIDFRTRQGQTPMHKAVLNGNQTAVKTLLDLGASTNYKDSHGLTPLYYTVLYGKNPTCAEMLLHERAMIGCHDEQGWYEIHQACKLGLLQHLEHLMFFGADLDVTNASGNTALHICAVNNNETCARVLLFRGANKNIPNFNNQTPQQVAILAGNVSLSEVIKSFDEKDSVPFRELPTFSSRRPRASIYASTLSLVSRSRSETRLNTLRDDASVLSPPESMRSLPQSYNMYSDSGSYPASRDSDSPRSMSISSSSSGPGGLSRNDSSPSLSVISRQSGNSLAVPPRHSPSQQPLRRVQSTPVEEIHQREIIQATIQRENSSPLLDRHHRPETILEETSTSDDVFAEIPKSTDNVFQFPDVNTSHGQRESSSDYDHDNDHMQASGFPGQLLGPSLSDRVFMCIKPYSPSQPEGLEMQTGDYVQVMGVTDTGFWEGRVNDQEGWFPAHHVQEVRLRNKAGSLGDLLAGSRENTLMNRNTLATLIRPDSSDYSPRSVVLQRAAEGYGFVLRGAKSQLKPNGDLDFRPTPEFPALQYLDSVDPRSVSDKAGLKPGDFILEINGENVVRASHDRVVHLIRGTGDTLAMKVVTVKPTGRAQDWFTQQDKSMTMPNRKKKAPAPPQRDPRTSLSISRSEGGSMSEELAVMESLDQAIIEKKMSEEKKTASIRSRTAAKRVSCVELDNIGIQSQLERSKSTPDLLDGKSKTAIYATPVVPGSTANGLAVTIRPKAPPPAPPAEVGSPKKQAPRPPSAAVGAGRSTEVVTINTSKPPQYASVTVHVNKEEKKTESPYESSFRPGDSAKMSDDPSLKDVDKDEKQNVSFAEDKVLDHAASFLKKHPNAKLLITTEAQKKVRNRTSGVFEPEPDYDDDSGEDKPASPVKIQDKRSSVTVISVGQKKQAPPSPSHPQASSQSSRYTIHSTIPTDEPPKHNVQSQAIVIPPRPDGPAPSPPNQSTRQQIPNFPAPAPPVAKVQPLPDSTPPSLPQTPPSEMKYEHTMKEEVSVGKADSQTVPSAPPPPPPPPPPAPPAPSAEQLIEEKSNTQTELTVKIPVHSIAAAVAKRNERIEKEGLNVNTGANKPKPVAAAKNDTQMAILAAVARRREKLEQQSENRVVDDIETRLQKTKKLQAARFHISGSKSPRRDTSNDNVQKKPNVVQSSETKTEATKKPVVSGAQAKPAKQENKVAATEISFKVKPVNSKPQSGMTEIKPKITTNSSTSKFNGTSNVGVKKQESLKVKTQPLEKTIASEVNAKSDNDKPQESNKTNGQSDFLALAEKKRQEYLQRKQRSAEQKSPPDSKSSSVAGTPEHKINQSKSSPPVSAKPKSSKGAKTESYTEFQSPQGLVKVKTVTNVNGETTKDSSRNYTNVPPPPPGFRDGGHIDNAVVQLEIIPPPAHFSGDSGVETSNQHSPAFSPDTASLVSSLSTLSSLSGDQNEGRGNGYDDLIAPPPPGFDDNDPVIAPPPQFGNEKRAGKFSDKPVESWLCIDVLNWLDSLKLSQYKDSFQQSCIDGKKLAKLTRNNYIELGVTQVAHRMNIERAIKKASYNPAPKDIVASEHL